MRRRRVRVCRSSRRPGNRPGRALDSRSGLRRQPRSDGGGLSVPQSRCTRKETSAATSSCGRRWERRTSSRRLREKSLASKTRRFRLWRRQTISRMLGCPRLSVNESQNPLARDNVALVVNSRFWRSQDQLHIHIGCLSRRMRQRLRTLAPGLPEDEWARIRGPMSVANAPYGPGCGRGELIARLSQASIHSVLPPRDAPMRPKADRD